MNTFSVQLSGLTKAGAVKFLWMIQEECGHIVEHDVGYCRPLSSAAMNLSRAMFGPDSPEYGFACHTATAWAAPKDARQLQLEVLRIARRNPNAETKLYMYLAWIGADLVRKKKFDAAALLISEALDTLPADDFCQWETLSEYVACLKAKGKVELWKFWSLWVHWLKAQWLKNGEHYPRPCMNAWAEYRKSGALIPPPDVSEYASKITIAAMTAEEKAVAVG